MTRRNGTRVTYGDDPDQVACSTPARWPRKLKPPTLGPFASRAGCLPVKLAGCAKQVERVARNQSGARGRAGVGSGGDRAPHSVLEPQLIRPRRKEDVTCAVSPRVPRGPVGAQEPDEAPECFYPS